MSNINYSVWGQPDTWTHWSASTNPTTETLYGSFRTGASDWDNSDFDDYPYFKIPTVVNLRNLLVNGNIAINEPLDNTLAYAAISNSDLPQCNRYVFNSVHHTINDYIAKADTIPTPFSLGYYYRNDNTVNPPCMLGNFYGFDGFPSNALTIDYGKMQRFSPFASYDTVYTNVNGDYNPILRIAPVTSFGVKSVILEIIVGYIDYDTYMLTGTLKSYLNHTADWLQAHPVVMAYCMPYFRTTTNGSYTSNITNPSMRFTGVCPIFYTPYRDKSDTYDIYNYLSTFNYRGGTGCFPIFGGVFRDSFSTSISIGVSRVPDDQMSKTNLSRYAVIYGAEKGELHYTGTEFSGNIYCTLDLSVPENVEYIMRGAAAYGLFFCQAIGTLGSSGRDSGDSERWIDNDMYCGVVTDTGLTFGDYTRGEDNAENSVYNWTNSTQTPFNPEYNPDPTHYDYETTLPTGNAVASDYYVSKRAGDLGDKIIIDNLMQSITNASEDPYDKNFLFQEPLKAVLDYRRILLKPIDNREVGNAMYIPLGRFVSPSATPFTGWISPVRFRREYLGSYRFWRTYNNFMDFEPYTQAVIYVPYCGIKELPMNIFAGHEVKIYINADNVTGEIEALIFVDNIEWGTMHGMASEELPLIGETSMTAANTVRELDYQLSQNEFAKLTGIAGSLAGASISASFKNPMGVVTQGLGAGLKAASMTMQTMEIEYEIAHTKPEPLTIQKGSANIERMNVQYPFIMIQTPIIIKNDNETEEDVITRYGKIKGFKCCETGVIGDFHGLTKCSSAILDGISCTYTEKQMLLEALQEGVIL